MIILNILRKLSFNDALIYLENNNYKITSIEYYNVIGTCDNEIFYSFSNGLNIIHCSYIEPFIRWIKGWKYQ